MNLTSYLANKCFEFLLKCGPDEETWQSRSSHPQVSKNIPLPENSFLPPWAVDPQIFESLCDGCSTCLSHCENNILVLNKDGLPRVDFSRGSCSFCGACAQNCPTGALFHDPGIPPWNIRASISANCLMKNRVLCQTCLEQCSREAILIPHAINNDSGPEILLEKCDGCGACIASCPARAIAMIHCTNSQNPNT